MGKVVSLRPRAPAGADLVERCLQGDAPAWRELYAAHVDRVGRFLRRLGIAPGDLEDVLQETFVSLHQSLADYDGRVPLPTWLLGIAMNHVRGHRRTLWRRRFARLVGFTGWGDPQAGDPERPALHREAARELQWVLGRMSDKQREVFVLYEIEALDGPTIARMLGCSVNTVWSRARLAQEDFRRLLRQRNAVRGGGSVAMESSQMDRPNRLVEGPSTDVLGAQAAALVRGADEALPEEVKGRVWLALARRMDRPGQGRRRWPVAALAAAAVAAGAVLWIGNASSPDGAGRVLQLEGDVRADGSRLSTDSAVEVPARLRVARGGSAQIAIERGDIRVDGPAVVRLERDGAVVESGRALHRVTPGHGRFVVRLGDYAVVVQGTQFWTGRAGDEVSVCLLEGRVEVRAEGAFVTRLSPGDAWRSSERAPAIPRDLACRLPTSPVAVAPVVTPGSLAAAQPQTPPAPAAHVIRPPSPLAAPEAIAVRPVVAGSDLAAQNALFRLAEQRASGGDAGGALDAWIEYRSRFPEGALSQEADLSILEMRLRLGSKQSRQTAEAFLRRWPSSEHAGEVQAIRGALFQRAGDCQAALGAFDRALSSRISAGRHDEALYGRAACLAATGRTADAARAYESYLQARPTGRFAAEAERGLRATSGASD